MKRIVCLLISVIVFSLTRFASADSKHVLKTQYISGSILTDWTKILDLDEKIDSDLIDRSVYDNLHSDCPPDFYTISSDELPRFLDEALCAPFPPSNKMLNEFYNMPPIIQQTLREHLFTSDNKLIAYPDGFDVSSMLFWVPEAWKNSPFRNMAPPSCYVEFLDFMEKYLDTPHEGFCFYYDIDEAKYPQMKWIDILIKCWVLQCRYNNEAINLNNPEFISLLKRTFELSNRLSKAEPNIKKQKGHQLFSRYYFGYTSNGQDQYTWANMIPWRITEDQQPLVDITITLSCAKNGSLFADKTTELFDCFVDHRQDRFNGKVDYSRYLYINKDWIDTDKWNAEILKQYGSHWKCLCMSQEYIESIWEIEKYGVPCIANDNYLSNTTWDAFDEYDNLTISYIKGRISAEDYVVKMDELAFSDN